MILLQFEGHLLKSRYAPEHVDIPHDVTLYSYATNLDLKSALLRLKKYAYSFNGFMTLELNLLSVSEIADLSSELLSDFNVSMIEELDISAKSENGFYEVNETQDK